MSKLTYRRIYSHETDSNGLDVLLGNERVARILPYTTEDKRRVFKLTLGNMYIFDTQRQAKAWINSCFFPDSE